jgi:hypothetical protein
MATQTTLPVTCENIAEDAAVDFTVAVVKIAANTATAAEQQAPLSEEDLMPFYFLSMAGGY